MMLVMEERAETGKQIAQQALRMAVQRVTNDNTIRYVRACLITWLGCIVLGVIAFAVLVFWPSPTLGLFVVAGIFGATGAVLSVATRLQAFRLQPCNQSNMNYWMSGIRVGIGVVAGITLLLLAPTILTDTVTKFVPAWGNPVVGSSGDSRTPGRIRGAPGPEHNAMDERSNGPFRWHTSAGGQKGGNSARVSQTGETPDESQNATG
jgi:hypothetical protein